MMDLKSASELDVTSRLLASLAVLPKIGLIDIHISDGGTSVRINYDVFNGVGIVKISRHSEFPELSIAMELRANRCELTVSLGTKVVAKGFANVVDNDPLSLIENIAVAFKSHLEKADQSVLKSMSEVSDTALRELLKLLYSVFRGILSSGVELTEDNINDLKSRIKTLEDIHEHAYGERFRTSADMEKIIEHFGSITKSAVSSTREISDLFTDYVRIEFGVDYTGCEMVLPKSSDASLTRHVDFWCGSKNLYRSGDCIISLEIALIDKLVVVYPKSIVLVKCPTDSLIEELAKYDNVLSKNATSDGNRSQIETSIVNMVDVLLELLKDDDVIRYVTAELNNRAVLIERGYNRIAIKYHTDRGGELGFHARLERDHTLDIEIVTPTARYRRNLSITFTATDPKKIRFRIKSDTERLLKVLLERLGDDELNMLHELLKRSLEKLLRLRLALYYGVLMSDAKVSDKLRILSSIANIINTYTNLLGSELNLDSNELKILEAMRDFVNQARKVARTVAEEARKQNEDFLTRETYLDGVKCSVRAMRMQSNYNVSIRCYIEYKMAGETNAEMTFTVSDDTEAIEKFIFFFDEYEYLVPHLVDMMRNALNNLKDTT